MAREKYDFSNFKKKNYRVRLAPTSERSYDRSWRSEEPIQHDFTLEEIENIIRNGDVISRRQLSRYFYRTNSDYRNNIDFLAHLPLYDNVVIPIFEENKSSKAQIIKAFYTACEFVDKLDIPNTFAEITTEWLKTGIYYGILRSIDGGFTVQTLPPKYCRTRFKDFNNLNILEFNLLYFEQLFDKDTRKEVVETFPEIIQKAWAQWQRAKKDIDPWVLIPAAMGGVCFCFTNDPTPPLLASIPALKKKENAIGREEKRDENELYKLLIQRMPIDSNGNLVFELEEVADIHESIARMLEEVDTVDVLTTFGDTTLESLQDSSAASQSADRVDKYRRNAWDALGRGNILFNPDGSSSLAYMIKKDESLMIAYLNEYETWVKFHLNDKFAKTNLQFDFQILPTTVFNRQDLQSAYFRGAQYGYSKMFAGVAMGIKQREQLSLMNFENDFLKMSEKMIPLQSSYTTPGGVVAGEEKNNSSAQNSSNTKQVQDIDNKGGRPELADTEKSEKTQANIAAEG